MAKQRRLSKEFLSDIKSGVLAPLLDAVNDDTTLCIQIREEGINIYYRGGSLLRVSKQKPGSYIPKFDPQYFINKSSISILKNIPVTLCSEQDTHVWVSSFHLFKHEMDLWFGRHPKEEREYQQLVVRENNYGKCGGKTDYLICDIEYAKAAERFDMIAVYWPSSGTERKKTDDVGLSFIEMKYADSALKGTAGLAKHIQGMTKFLSIPGNLESIKTEMVGVFNQMHDLGLISVKKKITAFGQRKPEFIFLLANHDPDSSILRNELCNIKDSLSGLPFDLRFVVSNFMGYGLYRQNVYDIETFLSRFRNQV